jgi:cytochrome d ubiquinol oxidase subunit II
VFVTPWLTPFAMSVGVFALTLCAFLAAVYLTLEAGDPTERAAFRARALASGVLVGVLALTVLLLAEPDLRLALTASAWALPLHVATGVAAIAAFACLWVEQYSLARIAVVAQVALILWGWTLAQYPYAIRPHLTLMESAAPENVLVVLLQVLGVGAVILVPSLLYLFGIFGPRGHATHGEKGSPIHSTQGRRELRFRYRTVGYLIPS